MAARVAHIAQEDCRLPPRAASLGSITRVVHELTVRSRRRFDTTVVSTRWRGDAPEEDSDGLRYVRIPAGLDAALLQRYFRLRNRLARRLGVAERFYAASPLYYGRYVRRIARRLARAAPDIVHLHNVSQFVPPLRRMLPRARLVLQMHCEWLVELPRAAIASRLASVDLVLGVSRHIAGQIVDRFPEVSPRCRVLPNGVDPDAFPPRERVLATRAPAVAALRARYGIRGPVVLFVGRLSSEKGVHVLLEAFGRVRERVPAATCLLVGPDWGPLRKVRTPGAEPFGRAIAALDRGYMERLRRLAAPHGARVAFTGAVPNGELALYHALADVVAAPSLLESFGIPAIEAGAAGLPVVASATGGLAETIVPGRTGILVPPGDAGALAAALDALLGDPALRRILGDAARERVLAHYTWDHVADLLVRYYEELLEARTGRAA
ncbi:MAG TPA: glycosyltransferase family 4 protein [Candidatus Binatia bacterium]|nr:glycosyltransferase family 4 protein [Candidatus Binatia bacterium]